jgi:hypothetical protein
MLLKFQKFCLKKKWRLFNIIYLFAYHEGRTRTDFQLNFKNTSLQLCHLEKFHYIGRETWSQMLQQFPLKGVVKELNFHTLKVRFSKLHHRVVLREIDVSEENIASTFRV